MKICIRRSTRTVILAVVAMAALPWAAVTQFDMPADQFMRLLAGALGALVILIAGAGAAVLLALGARRLWRRRRSGQSPP